MVPLDPQEQQVIAGLTGSLREPRGGRLPFSSCRTWGWTYVDGQLNKRPVLRRASGLFGSGRQTRTADMVVNSHPLYLLSYAGTTTIS